MQNATCAIPWSRRWCSPASAGFPWHLGRPATLLNHIQAFLLIFLHSHGPPSPVPPHPSFLTVVHFLFPIQSTIRSFSLFNLPSRTPSFRLLSPSFLSFFPLFPSIPLSLSGCSFLRNIEGGKKRVCAITNVKLFVHP